MMPILVVLLSQETFKEDYVKSIVVHSKVKIINLLCDKPENFSKSEIDAFIANKGEKVSKLTKFRRIENEVSTLDKIEDFLRKNIFKYFIQNQWASYVIEKLLPIIKHEKPMVLYTSLPPYSQARILPKLSKKSKVPFLIDFVEPMLKSTKAIDNEQKIKKDIEAVLLKKVSYITTASQEFGREIVEKNKRKLKYTVIHNGFEKHRSADGSQNGMFQILFYGDYLHHLEIETFIYGLKDISTSLKKLIEFKVIGTFPEEFRQQFFQTDIKLITKPFPKDEIALKKELAEVSYLYLPMVNFQNYSAEIVPINLFDYLSFQKPILAIGESFGIVQRILKNAKAGEVIPFKAYNKKTITIFNAFKNWEKNKNTTLKNNAELEQYTTQFNTAKMARLFLEISK